MLRFVPYLCLFLCAFLVCVLTTPLAKKIAWKVNAVDYPSQRRINKKPTARLGGIALFVAFVAAFCLQYIGTKVFGWPDMLIPLPHKPINYFFLGLAICIIFLTGVIDDIYTLKPFPKLCGQILAACVACSGGLIIGDVVNPFAAGTEIHLGWLAYPVTVVFLVAYTNIINLIDGLDGLATGVAGISSVAMFIVGIMAKRWDACALAIVIAGSCLGFLLFNFHPASIFLGDSGSLLLGFVMGSISLLNVTRVAGLTTIIVPLIIAGVPIIDTFSAIIRRKRAHVPASHADKGHIHHRLVNAGFNQKQAVLLIYAWTTFLCIGAIVITQVHLWPRIILFVFLIIISIIFTVKLHLFDPVLLHHYDPKTHQDTLITPDDPAFDIEKDKHINA